MAYLLFVLLGEFRIKLGKGVVFQALSGTQPAHIKKAIIDQLLFDENTLCSIKLSSNRPNMGYATHAIVGNLSDFRNLDFLVPDPYPDEFRLPKTLVFHDNVNECTAAAVYLNDRLPKLLRGKGLVKHYHGGMSKEYLTLVYDDFQQPDGACRILHATEGASTVILTSQNRSTVAGCRIQVRSLLLPGPLKRTASRILYNFSFPSL